MALAYLLRSLCRISSSCWRAHWFSRPIPASWILLPRRSFSSAIFPRLFASSLLTIRAASLKFRRMAAVPSIFRPARHFNQPSLFFRSQNGALRQDGMLVVLWADANFVHLSIIAVRVGRDRVRFVVHVLTGVGRGRGFDRGCDRGEPQNHRGRAGCQGQARDGRAREQNLRLEAPGAGI